MNTKTIVIVVLLLLVGATGVYLGANYKLTPSGIPAVTVTPTVTTVQTSPVATPTLIATVTPTVQPTATPTVDEKAVLISAIKAALTAEHGSDFLNGTTVTVSKIQGNYAQGAASSTGGGGMWFAAKVDGVWKLAWDGNGTISCQSIAPYNFPNTMISECWDETTQKSVTR